MATHVKQDAMTVVAAEDLTPAAKRFHAITLAGTLAQSNAGIAGILWTSTGSGSFASAVYNGITKAAFGSAVSTPGWPVKVVASGWLAACASGDQSIGRLSLFAAASGDIQQVMIDVTVMGIGA